MKTNSSLDKDAEEVLLLLEELGLTSDFFYQSLLPTMTALRSGRSPQAIGLEEKLAAPQDYLTILQQILTELEKSLSQWMKTLSTQEEKPERAKINSYLKEEAAFYRQFQETSEVLMQKLKLISQEGRLSPLGRLPINDAWEEIEKMSMKD
jgi:hypothetical protein